MELIGDITKEIFFNNLDTSKDYNEHEQKIKNNYKSLCSFFAQLFDGTTLSYHYSDRKDYYRIAISQKVTNSKLSHGVNGRLSFRLHHKSCRISIRINVRDLYIPFIEKAGFTKRNGVGNGYVIAEKNLNLEQDIFGELANIFSDLLVCGISEESEKKHEVNNLLPLWLDKSLIDALTNQRPELFNPDSSINKYLKQPRYEYPRSSKLANKIKKDADYKCAVDGFHETFSIKDGSQYMEAHHFIPMFLQGKYSALKVSLDVKENMLCLCPTCHREFHYAGKRLIERFYEMKKMELENVGIKIELKELLEAYQNSEDLLSNN